MTNTEAIQAVVGFTINNNTVTKALIDAGIDGNATYTAENSVAIDTIAVTLLQLLLSKPDIVEGDYSEKYDRAAIEERIAYLSKKLDLIDLLPTIRGIRPW